MTLNGSSSRSSRSSSSGRRSWMEHKEVAKTHFQNERYLEALSSYQAAVVNAPEAEKQILLSNMVACRLKLGGPTMAAAAIEEAKQCIAINERWAKGHVRLASAYIALGDHSNDACNSLQRAIALDPSNQTARQMLMKELRRDRVPPTPSAPPEFMDDSSRHAQSNQMNNNDSNNHDTARRPTAADATTNIDDGITMTDRLKFYWMRAVTWYFELPEDTKTFLKVTLGIVALYVMMGGRFGLGRDESLRGNYGDGNAYDRYRSGGARYDPRNTRDYRGGYEANTYRAGTTNGPQPNPYTSAGNNHHHHAQQQQNGGSTYGSYDQRRTDTYQDDGYAPPQRSRGGSFHFPNLFDGSVPSMICLGGIMYLCHRNGINPFQILMMMNMMNGRGRHGGMGMGGMGMGGYGMGAMGYGMARNAGMFGRRGPPRRGF